MIMTQMIKMMGMIVVMAMTIIMMAMMAMTRKMSKEAESQISSELPSPRPLLSSFVFVTALVVRFFIFHLLFLFSLLSFFVFVTALVVRMLKGSLCARKVQFFNIVQTGGGGVIPMFKNYDVNFV